MTLIRIRNTPAALAAPAAPVKDDGSAYAFEMTYQGGAWRAYADAPGELVEALIPDYSRLTSPRERAKARISLALKLQVQVQASIVTSAQFDLAACTDEQRSVLLGSREVPPAPTHWDAPVPLVLVSAYYQPAGQLPAPTGREDSLWWIDPGDDWRLLESLHRLGVIGVHVRSDLLPPYATEQGD